MIQTTSSRRREYDLLRVLSMAAVVYLHTAAGALRQGEDPWLWHVSNTLTALCSAAVPLFFMLSGALLLRAEKTADPRYVLRRRLPRLLLPLLAWSGLVLALTWYGRGGQAALDKLLLLPSMTVLTPYWFLYALIPLYLLSPLLKRLTDHLQEVHWRYLLLLWLVLTVGLNTLWKFLPAPWNLLAHTNEVYTVSLAGGYGGYFLLGAWLDRLERLPSRRLLWSVIVLDWAVITLGTWWASAQTGGYDERFKDYMGVFTMLLSAALFLLARSCWEGKSSGRALTFLAENSFGVYLSHPMSIFCMEGLLALLPGGAPGGAAGQGIVFLLALAGCLIGTVLAGSVPGLCLAATGQRFREACGSSNLFSLRKRGEND